MQSMHGAKGAVHPSSPPTVLRIHQPRPGILPDMVYDQGAEPASFAKIPDDDALVPPYSPHDAECDQTIVLNGCDHVRVFLKAAAMMLLEIFPYPDQVPAGRMPDCHELAGYI